ncbi:MAG: hypothetical protein IJ833_02335 [Lachnospiraceae bacterium]|nr:hypothetical protein [Lachnospiraceae bacterium]
MSHAGIQENTSTYYSGTAKVSCGAGFDNHILFKLMNSSDCHTTNRQEMERLMTENGFAISRSEQLKGFIWAKEALDWAVS